MIEQIRLAGIWVTDQARAFDFYVNKLSFDVQSDVTMANGYRWLELAPHNATTGLAVAKPYDGQDVKIGGQTNVVFTTPNLVQTHAEMVDQGVVFTQPPERQLWGGLQATFADPDGNLFLLVERDD